MNNTSSVAQFLAVLGGSANPSLLQNSKKTATDGEFQNMVFAQFGHVQSRTQTNYTTGTNGEKTGMPGAIWQMISTQKATDASGDAKNSLVLHLSEQGIDEETIDALLRKIDQDDLITIIKDPRLTAKLQSAIEDMQTADNDTTLTIPALSQILQSISGKTSASADLTVDIASMSMEEFKEWKKQNFSDLAGFLGTEKTKTGSNGEIIKILQGPAFLAEEGDDASIAIVEIIPPENPLNPVQFALFLQNTNKAGGVTSTNGAFVPLPLSNLANITPEMQTALQQAAAQLKNQLNGGRPSATAGTSGNAAFTAAMTQNAGNTQTSTAGGGIKTQANSNSMLTPFMTPAEMNAFNIGGDGTFDLPSGMMAFEAGFKTASQASNPLLNQPSAGQTHPTSQMVAISLTKMASGKGDEAGSQKYRLQLDPPEMGRIDVDLEFEAGHKVRAMIVVEKPETLAMLQRDSHALLKALQDAGFDGASQDNLNFNLSQGQNDPAGNGDRNSHDRQNGQNALLSPDGDGEMHTNETRMSMVIDPLTGQQRINMVV